MLSRVLTIKREQGLLPLIGHILDYSSDMVVSVILLVDTELKASKDSNITWLTRFWLWRHGFISTASQVYDFDSHSPKVYLSHVQHRLRACKIDEPLIPLFHDKRMFDQLLNAYDEYLPECYGVITDGEVRLFDNEESRSIDDLVTAPPTGGLVVKPTEGMGGRGVDVIESNSEDLLLNRKQHNPSDIMTAIKEHTDSLLYERVQQADYAADIYSDASNTLRIITMIDPDIDQAFVARAVHRFGTDASAPVDNWSRGGICAGVDLETGKLMEVAETPGGGKLKRRKDHPNTGAPVTGVEVENWEMIREEICSIAEYLSRTPYIGWDVIVTDHAFKIIEANGRPGPNTMQIPGPMLTDERIQRFYRHHDVI